VSQHETELVLSLAYLLPVALLALLLFRARLAHWQKGLLLAVLPLFYIAHYHALHDLAGWPSLQPPPDRFELLGQEVREPGQHGDADGYIRLWVRVDGEPRSRLYQLPYSREMHQRVAQAAQRQADGHPQNGIRTGGAGESTPTPGDHFSFEDRKIRRPPAKTESAGG